MSIHSSRSDISGSNAATVSQINQRALTYLPTPGGRIAITLCTCVPKRSWFKRRNCRRERKWHVVTWTVLFWKYMESNSRCLKRVRLRISNEISDSHCLKRARLCRSNEISDSRCLKRARLCTSHEMSYFKLQVALSTQILSQHTSILATSTFPASLRETCWKEQELHDGTYHNSCQHISL